MGTYHHDEEKRETMKPSAKRILDLLRSRPIRYLPKRARIETDGNEPLRGTLLLLGCKWEWSWTILQETKTADYRKRISEINGMDGYAILSFHAPYRLNHVEPWDKQIEPWDKQKFITRHGYILVAEPQAKGKAV